MQVPRAHYVNIDNCENPHCRAVHIMLLDEDEQPIAELVVLDESDGRKLMDELKNAFYVMAAGREDAR